MNQVKLFAVYLSAMMRESEQSDWNITNDVVDRSVARLELTRSLRKLPSLSPYRPDW